MTPTTDEERARSLVALWEQTYPGANPGYGMGSMIASLLAQIRAEERERCAQIADGWKGASTYGLAAALRASGGAP